MVVENSLEKLVDYYRENKLSHAYLIETNNVLNTYDDLIKVIKKIFCNSTYEDGCCKCNICNLIDQNYLPSLRVIEANGTSIKKEQILELKRNFSSIPVYTKDNIYIIKQAEKLNDASANTMLKFLEEPLEHIIGFFITDNINNVILTIRSRCEIIKNMYELPTIDINSIFNEENKIYFNVAREYIKKLEVEKSKMIMYNKDVVLSNFSEKDDLIKLFQIMLIIYDEALKVKMQVKKDFSKLSDLDFLLNFSSKQLLKRINLITTFLDDINSNVNKELLLDKFVIELGEEND
jgi:DNA polymerase-3 subunit delta'